MSVEITLPQYISNLCSVAYIKPFSHYVERASWKLQTERVEIAFLNKKGIYCFWWSGSKLNSSTLGRQ